MKIGIIALGLIGGSLLKALSGKGFNLTAVSQNKSTIEKAKAFCGVCSSNLLDVKDCDVVFVCTPMNKTVEMLNLLEKIVSPNCIVADVASVKEFVMNKKRPYRFIGTHPMAGLETNGFSASVEDLFTNAKWVLTPSESADESDVETLKNIIELTGAKTFITDSKQHDFAVSLISHLPMLMSQALFKTAQKNELAMKLASSGFRDMTRLAMTDSQLAQDMITYNYDNIFSSFEEFQKEINTIADENYKGKIEKIAQKRRVMYSKEGKNIYMS